MEVILTHEHADFDAVAALAGMARLVPHAHAVLPREINANVEDFLTLYGRELPLRHRDQLPRSRVTRAWLVDTQSPHMVRGMTTETPRTIVDHHGLAASFKDGRDSADVQSVGATSTLIAERLAAAGLNLSAVEATLLLLGVHEDTGSLAYPGTTARDARAAAWLIEQGADLDILSRFLRHPMSEPARALHRVLLDQAETVALGGHEILVAAASVDAGDEEVSSLATRMMELLGPDAVVLLLDMGGHIQLVARSATDLVDVGALARALGGGGHARASAAVLRGNSLSVARERAIEALPLAVLPGRLVADIMTWGRIRTVRSDQTIGQALAYARRFGHEGYPVLAGSDVLGVVTRRDLDLAAHHHLSAELVTRLVSPEPAVVQPQDTVDRLQEVMTTHDVGQVPVVEGGRLVGIVTRTDLLKLWAERAARRGARVERLDLAAALPADWLAAVHHVAEVAADQGWRTYLVGGVVRDLLLGRPHGPDIDIVVEGDALELARHLAQRHGGKVRQHPAFGTATWRHDRLAVDLITARSEYYEAPTALPMVEPGSLRSDLRRRDFSINALAVDLQRERFGRVIDPFNGLADLRQRRIRVLHKLSFVEDPTRILRAVRYAVRLGFDLEPDTAERVPEALPLLSYVSGARIVNELRQSLLEPQPAPVLAALADHEVLDAIAPGLTASPRLGVLLRDLPSVWQGLREAGFGPGLAPTPDWSMALALWLADNGPAGVAAGERLRLPGRVREVIAAVVRLCDPGHVIAQGDLPASAIYRCLHGDRPAAIVLATLAARSPSARRHLRRYAEELAGITSPLSGEDLAALGVPPGPEYRRVLDAVHDAVLDGQVPDRPAAIALARHLLAQPPHGPA